jgi:tetratricopeptide (TPR) repeat protein
MRTFTPPADLQRWSADVARDPASLSFLPLAQAYRRMGERDAARRICLRGLETHPTNVEAHALLARLCLEAGEREKAFDEWSMVLRLDPGHFEAHRGMGFVYLERGDLAAAARHLDEAARLRPDDPAVREARRMLATGAGAAAGEATASAPAKAAPAAAVPEPPSPGRTGAAGTRDPRRVFDELAVESPFLGALVLDERGLVLAGRLREEGGGGGGVAGVELLAAALGPAVAEAGRTAGRLSLGEWTGLLLETERATFHLSGLGGGVLLTIVVERDAPAGWVVRVAERAAELAQCFLEGER